LNQNKRRAGSTHLSQRQPLTSPEKWLSILEQWLNLLNNSIDQLLCQWALLLFTGPQNGVSLAIDLADKGIDEKVDLGTLERASFLG
jgi:hypothetical protein